MDISITDISSSPDYLDKVICLYKKNSSLLGLFPRGAFEQYAQNNEILLAVSSVDNQLLGYLLYRRVRRNHSIAISQLCVKPALRGCNVSNALIGELKAISKAEGCIAITLNCREDYSHAAKVWGRNKFYPSKEKEGKNKKGYRLLHWVWDNTEAHDLFGHVPIIDYEKFSVVVDANIIIKYREGNDELVGYLMGDWLIDEVEIFYTPESLVEISRNADANIRSKTKDVVATLNKVSVSDAEFESVYERINSKLPHAKTKQDEADRKQLAYSCAFDADFFISTDNTLVDNAQCISDEYNILIYRPEEFIIHFDKHLNNDVYNPSRLKGSEITISRIDVDDTRVLESVFLQCNKSELSSSFKEVVRGLLSDIDHSVCQKVVKDGGHKALLGFKIESNCIAVKLLRVLHDRNSQTLTMQIIEDLIKEAVDKKYSTILIQDTYFNISKDVLLQAGFFELEGKWRRPIISGVLDYNSPEFNAFSDANLTSRYMTSIEFDKSKLERDLWPLKFTELDLPVYVIPIQKNWAMNLFDYELAEQDLFGSDPSLAFNCENVYYSATRNNLEYPARILWYVKSDEKEPKTGFIRAVSYLDGFTKGSPKELYREFKRLGVYEWKNVYDLAKNDIDNKISAILFSKTELLNKPISFIDFQNIQRNQIQGPFRISNKKFIDIYTGKAIIDED